LFTSYFYLGTLAMNPSRLYLELDVRHNVELMYDISIVNVYL
jgi:hypothetical protein